MDVTQLKTLIHVAELGSLSKAADRLHIAQPALSRQIRLLERELGTPLFDRHGRGMIITEAGREVLNHAEQVMASLEAIRLATSSQERSYTGLVTVGTTPTIAEIVTVPLVRRIRDLHPQLALRFSSAFSGHLLDWLQRGELELAFSYDPPPLRSLRIIPVMVENLVVVRKAPMPQSREDDLPFVELAREALVLPSPRHGLRAILDQCALEKGITLNTAIEADSFSAMIELVRAGYGSTVLPLASIHRYIETGVFDYQKLVSPTPRRKLVLAFPADRPVAPAARFVGENVIAIARDLVDRGIWFGEMIAPPGQVGQGSGAEQDNFLQS